jgi:signal transduction histidine kinase
VQDAVATTLQEAARSLGFTPRLIVDGPVESRITDEVRVELLPTLREALSNVARHAQASAVVVELRVDRGTEVVLEVRDDGCGVATDHRPGEGLRNMAQRAARLGGSCTYADAPSGGTVVRWVVPTDLGG